MLDAIDKRSGDRRRTVKGARIVFNAGRSTIDCRVRNLSSRGARLEVTSAVGIPNTFDLLIDANAGKPCRVAWRTLKESGVEFQTMA